MDQIVLNLSISFLSALAGAYAGSLAATKWQEKKEAKELVSKKESAVINALILCRHYGEIVSKIKNKIIKDDKKLEWYEINLIEVFMPPNLQHNAGELISLLGKENYDLVSSVIHAEWVAKSAIEITARRDDEFRELQKHLISKDAPRHLSEHHAVQIIGEAWSAKVSSLTKEMHVVVNAAIAKNKNCFNELAEQLPNKRNIKDAFERIEPTISL